MSEEAIDILLSKKTSYKAILFDIDGTLADSWKLAYDATVSILQNNEIASITREEFHEGTKYCTPDRLARHAGLLPEKDGARFQELGNQLAMEFDELYISLISQETAGFYAGMKDLVTFIPKNISLAVLTNACVEYAHKVLKANSVHERFSSIHGADSVRKPKPNPDGLLQCCKEMNVDPKDCVYIGDSPTDAIAAENAGMLSIGVAWGSHDKRSLNDSPFLHICSSVDELSLYLPQEE